MMERKQSLPTKHPILELEVGEDLRVRPPANKLAGPPTSSHLLVNLGPVLKPGTTNYVAVPALTPRRPVVRKGERVPVDIRVPSAVSTSEFQCPSNDTDTKCARKRSAAENKTEKSSSGASRADQISETTPLPSTQPSIQRTAGKHLGASATHPMSPSPGSSVDYLHRRLLVDTPDCPLPGPLNLQHVQRIESPSQQVAPHQQPLGSAISCDSLANIEDIANLHVAFPQQVYPSSSTPITRVTSPKKTTASSTVVATGHRTDTTRKQIKFGALKNTKKQIMKQKLEVEAEKRKETPIKSTIKRHPDGSYSAITPGPSPTDIRVAHSGLKSSPDKNKHVASKKATKSTKGKKVPAKETSELDQKSAQSSRESNKEVNKVVPLSDSHMLHKPEKSVTEESQRERSSGTKQLESHHSKTTVQPQEALEKSDAKMEDAIGNQVFLEPAENRRMENGVESVVADRDKKRGQEKVDSSKIDKKEDTVFGKEASSVEPQEQFAHNSKKDQVKTRNVAIQTEWESLDAIVHTPLSSCFLTQSEDLASQLASCDVDEDGNEDMDNTRGPPSSDNQQVPLDLSLRKCEEIALRASSSATNLLCLEEEDLQARETNTHCKVDELQLVCTQDDPDLLWETSEYVAYKERVTYADVDHDVWLNEGPSHQISPFSSPGLPRWSSQISSCENISSPESVRNMADQSFGFSPSGVEIPAASDSDSENEDQIDDFSMHGSFSGNFYNGYEDDGLLSSPEIPRDELSGELVEGLEVEGIPLEVGNPTEEASFVDVETSDGLVDDIFEEDMIRGDTPAPVDVSMPLKLEVKGRAVDVRVLNAEQEKENEIGRGMKRRSFYATRDNSTTGPIAKPTVNIEETSQDDIATAEMVEVKGQAIETCLSNHENSPDSTQEFESSDQQRENCFYPINENVQMRRISKPDHTEKLLHKQFPKGEDSATEGQRSHLELFEEQSQQTSSCSKARRFKKNLNDATLVDEESKSMVKSYGRVDTALRDEEEVVILEEGREPRVVGEIVVRHGEEVIYPEQQQGTLQGNPGDADGVETGSCNCAHPVYNADPGCFPGNISHLHPLSAELKTQLLSLLWPACSVVHSMDHLPELVPTRTEQFLLQKAMDQTIGAVDCFLKIGEFRELFSMYEDGEEMGAFKATPGWQEMGAFVQHGVVALNTLSNRMSELFLHDQIQKRRLQSNPEEFPWIINSEDFVKRSIFSTSSDSSSQQEVSVIPYGNEPGHSSRDQPLHLHPSQTGKIVFASPASSSASSGLSQVLRESREARTFPDGQHISQNEPESFDLAEDSVVSEGLAKNRNAANEGCESTFAAGNREKRKSTNQCQNHSDQDQAQTMKMTNAKKRHLKSSDHVQKSKATSGQAGLATKENSDYSANHVEADKPAKDQITQPCHSNSQAQKNSEHKLSKESTEPSRKNPRKRLHSCATTSDCDVYCFSDNETSHPQVKYPRSSPGGLPVRPCEASSPQAEAELRTRGSNDWHLPRRSAVVDNFVQLDCSTQERHTGQRSSLQRVPETESRESQFSRSKNKIETPRSPKRHRIHRNRNRASSCTPDSATKEENKRRKTEHTNNNESPILEGHKGHRKSNVHAGQGQTSRVMSSPIVVPGKRGTPPYSNRFLENLREQPKSSAAMKQKSRSRKGPASTAVVSIQDAASKKSGTSADLQHCEKKQRSSNSSDRSIKKLKQSSVHLSEMSANEVNTSQHKHRITEETDPEDELACHTQKLPSHSSFQSSEDLNDWGTNCALDLSQGDLCHGFDREEIAAFEPTRREKKNLRPAGGPGQRDKSTLRHTKDSSSDARLRKCAVLVSNFADEADGSDREGPEAELNKHGAGHHNHHGDQQETQYRHGDREGTWHLRARKETKERRTTRQTKSLSPVSLSTSESFCSLSTADSPKHKHRHTTKGVTNDCARRQSKRRRHASTPANDFMTPRYSPRSCKLSGKGHSGYARTRLHTEESSPEEVIRPMHKRGFQFKEECFEIVDKLYNHPLSLPFRSEIRSFKIRDYYKIVKFPMCLDIIAAKLRQGTYLKLEEFVSDMKRIFWNFRLYHGTANTRTVRKAAYVERLMNQLFHKYFPNEDFSGISGTPHHNVISRCYDNRASPVNSDEQVHIPTEIRQLLG